MPSIYYQYKDKCTNELFGLSIRPIGNLTLKRLWVFFIEVKVTYLEAERREEAIYFEELCGTQKIAEFNDLVNSPTLSTSKMISEDVQGLSTTTIHSILNQLSL